MYPHKEKSNCSHKCDNHKYVPIFTLKDVPKNPLYTNGFSYCTIARDLDKLYNDALQDPTVQEFIQAGDTGSPEFLLALNIVLQSLIAQFVDIPVDPKYNTETNGFGKRVTLVSSDGSVLIDTSYSQPNSAIFFANEKPAYQIEYSEVIQTQNYGGAPLTNTMPPYPLSISQSRNVRTIKQKRSCYGSSPQPSSPNDPSLWTYQDLQLHTTRTEILTSATQDWGWARRLSGTTQNNTYYVSRKITFQNAYYFYLRVAYEAIPLCVL